jgi:hypothetical protein
MLACSDHRLLHRLEIHQTWKDFLRSDLFFSPPIPGEPSGIPGRFIPAIGGFFERSLRMVATDVPVDDRAVYEAGMAAWSFSGTPGFRLISARSWVALISTMNPFWRRKLA